MNNEKELELYGSVEFYNKVMAERYLNSTDYIANKMVEYQFLGKELEQDYTEILKKREEAREVIRKYVEMNN